MVQHFERVASDPTDKRTDQKMFSKASVKEGRRLANFFLNKNVLAYIIVNLEIMTLFEKMSVVAQANDQSIIGQAKAKKDLIDGLHKIRDNHSGPLIEKFLGETKCFGTTEEVLQDVIIEDLFGAEGDGIEGSGNQGNGGQGTETEQSGTDGSGEEEKKPCESIEKMEKAKGVEWRELDLTTNKLEMGLMSTELALYLDTIEDAVEQYFPVKSTEDLEILDQRLWKDPNLETDEDIQKIKQKFKNAADILGKKDVSSTVQNEFVDLMKALWNEKGPQCSNSEDLPTHFWGDVLRTKSDLTEDLKEILQRSIVIPMGTAEAERSFSTMNHIKTKDKSSLQRKPLESQMRIRMNGIPYTSMNIDPYTTEFLRARENKPCDAARKAPKQRESLDKDEDDDSISSASTYSSLYA